MLELDSFRMAASGCLASFMKDRRVWNCLPELLKYSYCSYNRLLGVLVRRSRAFKKLLSIMSHSWLKIGRNSLI